MADKSITKTELVASIASATGQSQSAVSGVLDSLFATIFWPVVKPLSSFLSQLSFVNHSTQEFGWTKCFGAELVV